MGLFRPRITLRWLMVLVLVAAVTLALIPIVHRALYPDSFSTYYLYVGDTLIFSVEL